MVLTFQTLKDTFKVILLQNEFSDTESTVLAEVFAETTIDGVFSHGINRFPRFIEDVKKGIVKPGIKPELKNGFNAIEQWDGRKGAGISNAMFSTDRCMELASAYGVGCVGLRNTNHWMRGGSYGWRAANRGFLFLGWTNTLPNMPSWGGSKATIGNNPFVLAIPRKEGHLVLDMAMSQYSYGKLEWQIRAGEALPEFGGYNRENKLTKDPREILDSKRILPAGLWKGSALALVLDLAAALISGGNTTKNIGELASETDLSQVFIALDIHLHMTEEQVGNLIEETLVHMNEINGHTRYPGQRACSDRERHLKNGVEIPPEVWEEIIQL